jgi:hypothetical protein
MNHFGNFCYKHTPQNLTLLTFNVRIAYLYLFTCIVNNVALFIM